MQKYSEFSPTGFDVKGLHIDSEDDNLSEWYVAPCSITRDSGVLDRSNFEVMCDNLREKDRYKEDWQIHRFGHWACGWFDIVLVRPDSACYDECVEIENALSDYPILDDDAFSNFEYCTAADNWIAMSIENRIDICNRFGISIFASRRDELPSADTSEFISYLAE